VIATVNAITTANAIATVNAIATANAIATMNAIVNANESATTIAHRVLEDAAVGARIIARFVAPTGDIES